MYRLYLFFILLLLCSHYFVIVVSILLKIIFEHTQISVSKIGIANVKNNLYQLLVFITEWGRYMFSNENKKALSPFYCQKYF